MFNRTTVIIVFTCIIAAMIYTFKRQAADDAKSATATAANDPMANANGYFKTHFQDESQFIVETIVTDLAEMACFARDGKLPAADTLSVTATETSESEFRVPVYELEIKLRPKQTPLKLKLKVTHPIWAPETYAEVTTALFQQLEFKPAATKAETVADWTLIESLLDGTAKTIEENNLKVSAALQKDFINPALHEKAALLLGAFALSECSGEFYDVRIPLCRISAHLTLARALPPKQTGVPGRLADVMLDTLMNRQVAALDKLKQPEFAHAQLAAWVRILKAWNTHDYRDLSGRQPITDLERVAWFKAFGHSVDVGLAWNRLAQAHLVRLPNYSRIANSIGYSVGVGHVLQQLSIPLEMRDIATVYELAQGRKLNGNKLVTELNRLPERCFSAENRKTVCVIGWGQWAMMFQRQLCHAMKENFNFLENKWGVPDEARKFSAGCDKSFSDLRLYPFVRRFNSVTVAAYHKGVDEALPVTIATPHLVAPQIWNTLCYKMDFAPLYLPNPDPHINEWHKHNPPPGTAYDPYPRMNHSSLVGRPDTVAQLEKLHETAPYDLTISYNLLRLKHHEQPTSVQMEEVYRPLEDFSATVLMRLAKANQSQPERYEELMTKAGELDPSYYLQLGDYLIPRNEAKAAEVIAKGIKGTPDSVHAASYAGWMIRYYLKQGNKDKARDLAEMAGAVYSYNGLEAKAQFLEETGDMTGAFEWYQRIEDRYGRSGPVMMFCARYKAKTGDARYDNELQRRMSSLFPSGLTAAKLADFSTAPTDGVIVREENNLTREAGINAGDIIVAAQGIRVHNIEQYMYARETLTDPQLTLIVWKRGTYREIRSSPPEHRFNVDFGTYTKP